MTLSRGLRATLLAVTTVALVLVYAPLALVVLNSFNTNKSFAWPPVGLTLRWWKAAAASEGARSALLVSVEVALLATVITSPSASKVGGVIDTADNRTFSRRPKVPVRRRTPGPPAWTTAMLTPSRERATDCTRPGSLRRSAAVSPPVAAR